MLTTDLRNYEPAARPTVVTIGTFDGLHVGHQTIIRKTCQVGRDLGLKSCVLTFEPHPQTVLNLHRQPMVHLLTTQQEKASMLSALGVDILVVLPFDRILAEMSAVDFVQQILIGKLRMKHCIFGHDHAFGKNRSGDFRTLQELGQVLDFVVEQVPALTLDGQVVRSSLIRRLLMDGHIRAANKYLGYPYRMTGRVGRGDGRGRSIGFPTMNLLTDEPKKLVPPHGVYTTTTSIDGQTYLSVTNIGTRPTFSTDNAVVVETHIPDYSGESYDRTLELSFFDYLRPERRFADSAELIRQIRSDINHALSASFTID